MFLDRKEAGILLAKRLEQFRNQEKTVVVALPRGGVPVAYEVAKELNLPLDIVCPRKIGAPMNLEFALGAITETGEGMINDSLIERLDISKSYLQEAIQKETAVAKKRLNLYRKNLKQRNFQGKTILIIDDGLATGSTMKAAISSLKKQGAAKIIVAVPVSPPETADEIAREVNHLIVLQVPSFFQAVGQFYENFSQTEDKEVIEFLEEIASLHDN